MKKTTTAWRLLVAAALVPGLSFAQAQDDAAPKPGFSMKEDAPPTGSNIRRSTAWGSSLPFDKTYAQLSPEEQRILKSRYVQMAEDDEPPFPAEGLGPLYKAFSKAQAATGAVGRFEMEVQVDASGEVTKVDILRSPDARLSKYAGTVAMFTKFKPAVCNGKPCAMGFPVSINFAQR